MKARYKLLLVFIVFLAFFVKVEAQEAHFKTGDRDLGILLGHAFDQAYKTSQIDTCYTSVVFAEFTILPSGKLSEIMFLDNEETPSVFRKLLNETILSTNDKWIPSKLNGKPVESKPYILPLFIELKASCHGKASSNGNESALNSFFTEIFKRNKKQFLLDCVLIPPIRITSQN